MLTASSGYTIVPHSLIEHHELSARHGEVAAESRVADGGYSPHLRTYHGVAQCADARNWPRSAALGHAACHLTFGLQPVDLRSGTRTEKIATGDAPHGRGARA